MRFADLTDWSGSAGRLALLTLATLIVLAPLCAGIGAGVEMQGGAAVHVAHGMETAAQEAPIANLTIVTIRGDRRCEQCVPQSCCSVALVNTARLKQVDGAAVLAVMIDTQIASQNPGPLVGVARPEATPGAAVAHVPLRL
jgi:hypothetical protein